VTDSIIAQITARIQGYDRGQLLQALAALQLLPCNADHLFRLEALASLAAHTAPSPTSNHLDRAGIEAISNADDPFIDYLRAQEDPCENALTECFTFFGGGYVVFPGIVEEATYVLRHLCRAIFHRRNPPGSPAFIRDCRAAALFVLGLSSAIAHKAGLERSVMPEAGDATDVLVPSRPSLKMAERAVTFTDTELRALCAARGVSPTAAEPFITEIGRQGLERFSPHDSRLQARPLVRLADTHIVGLPAALLPALRHRIICLAQEHGAISPLAEGYAAAVAHNVRGSLRLLGSRPAARGAWPLAGRDGFHEGFFTLDADKMIYVQLITDDLRDYDTATVFGQFDPRQQLGEAARTELQRTHWALTRLPGLNEVLILFLCQPAGRWMLATHDDPPPGCELLLLSAADLETIAMLGDCDEMTLHKFAAAAAQIRRNTHVTVPDRLTEFAYYRDRDDSYYFGDEARPDSLGLMPGLKLDLRRQALKNSDRHAVLSHSGGGWLEVVALHDSATWPLYTPLLSVGQELSFVLEGLPSPIWIHAPQYPSTSPHVDAILRDLCDLLGYWLWQFSPSLGTDWKPAVGRDAITILLQLDDPDAWEASLARSPDDVGAPASVDVTWSVDTSQRSVTVELGASCILGLQAADNTGERELMRRVLQAINDLAAGLAGVQSWLTSEAINAIIDRHAPLGQKKKLTIVDLDYDRRLDPSGVPRPRTVQRYDINRCLDEVGHYMANQRGVTPGPVKPSQRTVVLQDVVAFYYSQLQAVVASLRPEGLLEWLIDHHEAIVHEQARKEVEFRLPVELFADGPDYLRTMEKEWRDTAVAAACSRFVIEYVATQPSGGLRPISIEVYDRLQAIAEGIITWAFHSDIIHFGIGDVQLSFLPSERIGTGAPAFRHHWDAFTFEQFVADVRGPMRDFDAAGLTAADPAAPEWQPGDELQAAWKAEFGCTLSEFANLVGGILSLAQPEQTAAVTLTRSAVVQGLIDQLGWPKPKVAQLLESLSLKPRLDYLDVPPGFDPHDVYPWRFNRALSYLRRPLIHRDTDNGPRLLWGARHLYSAPRYLLQLFSSGRLKAQSTEMKQLLGRLQARRGKAFSAKVADRLAAASWVARSNVRKIGKRRIGHPGGDLGDVDVLAADPTTKRLLAIECKDLARARNPHELANELHMLFKASHRKSPAVKRHQRRVRWVKSNLTDVLRFLGLPPGPNWQVKGLVVVSQEMFTPRLFPSPLPVLSARRFEAEALGQPEPGDGSPR